MMFTCAMSSTIAPDVLSMADTLGVHACAEKTRDDRRGEGSFLRQPRSRAASRGGFTKRALIAIHFTCLIPVPGPAY